MSFQDPISDCLTRIRNGLMRGKSNVFVPYSKLKHELVNVLVAEGYLKGCVKTDDSVSEKPMINVELKYHNEEPVIKELKRISKPSLRKYSRSGVIIAYFWSLALHAPSITSASTSVMHRGMSRSSD